MLLVKSGVNISEIDVSEVIKNERTWQSFLRNLYLTTATSKSAFDIELATDKMQELYPGPYTIEAYYNKELGCFDYRLSFENPKEQTMWLLKYS